MHTFAKVFLFVGLAAVGMAANWTGKLIDATCHDGQEKQKATASCDIMANTSSFALQTSDGKVYKLDAAGNTKAAALVRGDIAKNKTAQFRVEGDMDGQSIKVTSIALASGTPGKSVD